MLLAITTFEKGLCVQGISGMFSHLHAFLLCGRRSQNCHYLFATSRRRLSSRFSMPLVGIWKYGALGDSNIGCAMREVIEENQKMLRE